MKVVRQSETAPTPIAEGRTRYLAHSENLMVVVIEFRDGPTDQPDKPHSHPHEQITYVAEGRVRFFVGEETTDLAPGDLITIPGDVPHAVQLLSDYVRLLDTFTPIRQEFL